MGKKKNLDALAASVNEALQSSNRPVSKAREDTAALLAGALPLKSSLVKEEADLDKIDPDRRSDQNSQTDLTRQVNERPEASPLTRQVKTTGQVEESPLVDLTCQPKSTGQANMSSQPDLTGQVNLTGQVISTGLPQNSLWNIVEPVEGYGKVPHVILDQLCKHLDSAEQSVYQQLFRLSWGFGKDTCDVSMPKLSQRANLGESTAKRAVGRLMEKGLVDKTERTFGYGKEQGITFWIPLPEWVVRMIGQVDSTGQVRSGRQVKKSGQVNLNPNKDLKKKYLKILSDHRQELVGAGREETRLVLERECRRQGIGFDLDLFNEIISR